VDRALQQVVQTAMSPVVRGRVQAKQVYSMKMDNKVLYCYDYSKISSQCNTTSLSITYEFGLMSATV
jgi:hypothetical protein